MVSMSHLLLLWNLYFAHACPPAVVAAIRVRSQCNPVGIEVEVCPSTPRGLPMRYGLPRPQSYLTEGLLLPPPRYVPYSLP